MPSIFHSGRMERMARTARSGPTRPTVTPTGTPRMSYSLIAVLHPSGG